MDKYEKVDYIISLIESLKQDKFSQLDVVIILEKIRKIAIRKRKQQYYRNKVKKSGQLTMKERHKKREEILEDFSKNKEKLFLNWLKETQQKWLKISEKYYGWISSVKLRELYCEFENKKIPSWQFITMMKDKYGEDIYKLKRYYNGKYYRAINLGKIFEINKNEIKYIL